MKIVDKNSQLKTKIACTNNVRYEDDALNSNLVSCRRGWRHADQLGETQTKLSVSGQCFALPTKAVRCKPKLCAAGQSCTLQAKVVRYKLKLCAANRAGVQRTFARTVVFPLDNF